jgi:hypothetical protein
MHKLEVGKPYHPNVSTWPEGGEYNFRAGQHELLLRFGNLKPEEIRDVAEAVCEFALTVEQGIIFLLYRFGRAIDWSDAPYAWRLVPENQRQLPAPEATGQTRALLNVILIEATTGIVRAIRAVTFSPEMTRALHQAIREQAAQAWNVEAFDADLAAIYKQFSNHDLLRRAIVRCRGGE